MTDTTTQEYMRSLAGAIDGTTGVRFQPIFPDTLRKWADELAAANARADEARDTALVEAAGALEAQALDADAQAKRFRGGSDPWADRTARSRALRNSAAAILALRDKPAPAVTVQEAARVLLDQPYGVMSVAFDAMEKLHGEGADLIMAAALRAIAGGGDE